MRESSRSYNDFFQNLERNSPTNQNASNSSEKTASNTSEKTSDAIMISDSSLISENSPLSSNHLRDTAKCDVLDLLKLVYRKVDAIEDHLIKLDVRIANTNAVKSVREKCTASAFEIIDLDQLTDFNLPVKSESDLETLEKKLETDQDFRMKLVSRKYSIILFTIQMKCHIISSFYELIIFYHLSAICLNRQREMRIMNII